MKKAIFCLFIGVAVVFACSGGQAFAKGCSATITCICKCQNLDKKSFAEVDVDGKCDDFLGLFCTSKCCPDGDGLKLAFKLCCKRHKKKCVDYCQKREGHKAFRAVGCGGWYAGACP